jgi:hypothetical protein
VSADNLVVCFSDDAPHTLVDRFASYRQAP